MFTRGLAGFLGGFTLLNITGNLAAPGFDSNEWWLDLRLLPTAIASVLLAPLALLLIAYAIRPARAGRRQRFTFAAASLLALVALSNVVTFYVLLARHELYWAIPLPLSLFVCAALVAVAIDSVRPLRTSPRFENAWVGRLTFAVCLIGFPLAQTWFFGHTDYRRRADAIVVFGARAYADGTPSGMLADRVRTGCELYRQGLAPRLILSGGPGDGAISEPQAMSAMAVKLGVPLSAIRLDEGGWSTQDTVRDVAAIMGGNSSGVPWRLLAVSHGYHLARVKLTCQRAGLTAYTVPAAETFPLPHRGYLLTREIVALWAYYLRPIIS